ncbi:MAG: hypothetical protein P8Y64_11515 [Gammaproteobacteria bacterium]|jgi:hypothetical protein
MTHYVHHVPGRLRVRTPVLKRNPELARQTCERLQARPGVEDVQASTVTGSLVIAYDRELTDRDAILEVLRTNGLVIAEARIAERAGKKGAATTVTRIGGVAGKAVLGMVVEKAVERSAAALIAAIL